MIFNKKITLKESDNLIKENLTLVETLIETLKIEKLSEIKNEISFLQLSQDSKVYKYDEKINNKLANISLKYKPITIKELSILILNRSHYYNLSLKDYDTDKKLILETAMFCKEILILIENDETFKKYFDELYQDISKFINSNEREIISLDTKLKNKVNDARELIYEDIYKKDKIVNINKLNKFQNEITILLAKRQSKFKNS